MFGLAALARSCWWRRAWSSVVPGCCECVRVSAGNVGPSASALDESTWDKVMEVACREEKWRICFRVLVGGTMVDEEERWARLFSIGAPS